MLGRAFPIHCDEISNIITAGSSKIRCIFMQKPSNCQSALPKINKYVVHTLAIVMLYCYTQTPNAQPECREEALPGWCLNKVECHALPTHQPTGLCALSYPPGNQMAYCRNILFVVLIVNYAIYVRVLTFAKCFIVQGILMGPD